MCRGMTRNQQIRKALELLRPPPAKRAECEHEIGLELNRIKTGAEAARAYRLATSPKNKGGLKRYHAALRELRAASNALDPAIKPWFSLAVSGKTLDLGREIEIAEVLLKQKSPPPARDATRQKIAVAAARELLEWWGHKRSVTRGGRWAELTKILVGDMVHDVFDHLRSYKRNPGPRMQKIRTRTGVAYFMRREPAEK
jgi:hypothetical protein